MHGMSRQPSQKIKDKKPEIADGRLNIICENPEEKHVAQQMHPTSMQEHTGDQGMKILLFYSLRRDGAKLIDKSIELGFR